MQRTARRDLLRAWTHLARYTVEDPPRTYEQAWGALRTIVRAEQ
jgi:hypothetical protein